MTKKEQLIEMFVGAKTFQNEFVAVAIETRGSQGIEIIINPSCNFDEKLEYYKKSYNDDLVLNSYNGIRIVSACSFDREVSIAEIQETMHEEKF